MCGIVGRLAWDGPVDPDGVLPGLLGLVAHRGPDAAAFWSDGPFFLGHRRLAIIDLTAGVQPMGTADGALVITFNGEIYNYRELRQARSDIEFHSTGDTEVLGQMLLREPVASVLGQLRGMFAFAWWDASKRELVAARDHFGIKPLYYWLAPDGALMLSSEIKSIRHMLAGDASVSQRALVQYFRWGSVEAPDTLLEGVKCLPRGHLLRWKDKSHWVDGAEAEALTREVVTNSVKAHLVSDVPVGVFLSGGLDSTLIAAIMKRQGMDRLQAFSIGYEADAGVPDETDAAQRTADFLGCDFYRERLTADSLLAKMDAYLASLDQPTGDALNTWLASQVAARHVKVTLSGLGADEWFGGYNYHRIMRLARLLPLAGSPLAGLTAMPARLLGAVLPVALQNHKVWKALHFASGAAGRTVSEMHAYARKILSQDEVAQLLALPHEDSNVFVAANEWRSTLEAELDQRAPGSWLQQLLILETETYLPNTLLRDNDVTSMAHSLELRVPFVDREVFDLAGRVAPSMKLDLRSGKRVLRTAFKDLLPEWIYNDTQKKTFTLPLMKWMRQPAWKQRVIDTLTSRRCLDRGWLKAQAVQKHLAQYHDTGLNDKRGWRLSQIVWLMFVLESWALHHFDRQPQTV
jgi:asparagine synthase (glutamine-hydrolysing)